MIKRDGAPVAGGNLLRGLATGATAAAALLLAGCMNADGTNANDKVNTPEWGVVVGTQELGDGTKAVRIGSCVMISGRLYLASQEQLRAAQDPNSGLTLVSEGIVEDSNGVKTQCAADAHVSSASGYGEGQLVAVPIPAA